MGLYKRSVAAAGPDHHVAVLFQDDVGAVVEVEDGDAVELGGGAAGLGHRLRVDEVNLVSEEQLVSGRKLVAHRFRKSRPRHKCLKLQSGR